MIGSKAMELGEAARQLESWGLQGLWTGGSSLLGKEKTTGVLEGEARLNTFSRKALSAFLKRCSL